MATFEKLQDWAPLKDNKDCSHGFCTVFCPQWCYILFPPPPPFSLSDEDESSGTAFSPLVIGIIGILGAAFLLISYYIVFTKYSNASLFRRRAPSDDELQEEEEEESVEQSQRQESFHLPCTNGLDEALIAKIAVCWYKTGEGIVDGTDCSVCLAEFREGESLRLLPKCSHAFHLQCIDTWLKSHSNCPLCRASIVVQSSDLESRVAAPASDHAQESVVVVVEDLDLERSGEEEEEEEEEEGDGDGEDSEAGNEGNACKDFRVIEIGEEDGRMVRRSVSMRSVSQDRVFSIADVLQVSMEDELVRRGGGENSKGRTRRSRGLHSIKSPIRMKRSVSSSKSCFARKGRGGVRFLCFEEEQQKSDGEEASLGTSSE